MPGVSKVEIWLVDFGMVAKVRPALLLTGEPADDELDLVTVLLHTTALRGNRWELNLPKHGNNDEPAPLVETQRFGCGSSGLDSRPRSRCV